jgi:hypothetical protein
MQTTEKEITTNLIIANPQVYGFAKDFEKISSK